MKKLIFIVVLLPFFSLPEAVSYKQNSAEYTISSNEDIFVVGEELVYVVSYSFLKLGEVKIRIRDKKTENGKTVYSTIAYIDSYSSVPFVDLHQIYESIVTTDVYSKFFRGLVREKEYSTYTEYKFNYTDSVVQVKKGKVNPPEVWTDSTAFIEKPYQDGLSIFFFARAFSGSGKKVSVPCFVNEKKEKTKINFYNEPVSVRIEALDYPVDCIRLDGETDFVSVFGLTGYFEGWFSRDEAAIPIVAKMKVIIGNVTLELKKWKREGWNPPKFKQ